MLAPSQVNATNIDYESHPETVTVNEEATALIEKLADSDILLYRLAVNRFERDVRAAQAWGAGSRMR